MVVGLFSLSACSSGKALYPVEGKVLYKGKEIGNVVVTFHPKDGDPIKTHKPSAMTGEDGSFRLTTAKDNGAAAGEYTVTFAWLKEVPETKEKKGMAMSGTKETFDAFAGTFADVSRSKHKVVIKAEANKLEPFRLE